VEEGGVQVFDVRECSLIRDSLLNDPNTSSPANVEASNLYKDNRREYTRRVRDVVEKSWDDE
jgi:ubiquitin-conjugating enzyme E2 A